MRTWLRQFLFRFQPLWSRHRIETELSEELRIHLEMATAANVAAGMSPEAAQRAAQLELGGVEQVKEAYRDERGLPWLDQFGQDLIHAIRQGRRNPGVTTLIVLSLALAIGASTSIFSVANQTLLRPLTIEHPENLVHLAWLPGEAGSQPQALSGPTDLEPASGSFSYRSFDWFREEHRLFDGLFAFSGVWGPNINIDGPVEIGGPLQLVSGNYFAVLGVRAARGRTLQPADDDESSTPAAVISHGYWQTRFKGDPAVVGRSILINDVPVTIVGIAPPRFVGPLLDMPADIFLPLAMAPLFKDEGEDIYRPGYWWLRIMGRLKPGVTCDEARASLTEAFRMSIRDGITRIDDSPRLEVLPAGAGQSKARRRALMHDLAPRAAMAALILIAACANVTNLLLSRMAARKRELGLRLALGASRSRIVRQLLTENLLLAIGGSLLGILLAGRGGDLLWHARGESFVIDLRVLAFTSMVGITTALATGLIPVWRALRFLPELKGRWVGRGRERLRLARLLMITQVAISFVLLVATALLLRSLHRLRAVDPGFNRRGLLLFSVDGFSSGHAKPDLPELYENIAAHLRHNPAIHAVTYSAFPLVSGWSPELTLLFQVPHADGGATGALIDGIGSNFFETFEIPIRAGRSFNARDHQTGAAPVTVISETFAHTHFGPANPIGQRIQIGSTEREVVGVVADVKQTDLRRAPPPTVYVPAEQTFYGAAHFAVRSMRDPATVLTAIRDAISAVDPNLPMANPRSQDAAIEELLTSEREVSRLGFVFATTSLLLACAGLYGLASYAVVQRTNELGIRSALGAQPRDMITMILRQSAVPVIIGIGLGMILARLGLPPLAGLHLLFELSPRDPATYGGTALLLLFVAMLAVLPSARRAGRTDVLSALRCE